MEISAKTKVQLIESCFSSLIDSVDLSNLVGKRIFITGGTGFFGLWLLSALRILNQNNFRLNVTILSRDPAAFLLRCPQFQNQSWINFVYGDTKSFHMPDWEFDLLLHAATDTSMTAHLNRLGIFDDIIMGTRRVLEFAEKCGCQRALLISSGAVYGLQPVDLSHQPDDSQLACNSLDTKSVYGEGKRVMELLGAIFQEASGIDLVVARGFAFCGPGLPLDGHFAIGNFIRDALYCDRITIHGDGTAMRSYLFGADLAIWLLSLLINGERGSSYNVGSDEAISISALAKMVRDTLAPTKSIEILNSDSVGKSSSGNRYVPAITRARQLGCSPWTSLEDALIVSGGYEKMGPR